MTDNPIAEDGKPRKIERPRISTHVVYSGTRSGEWFTARVNGDPLIGDKGGTSLFRSRKEAREEAMRRIEAGGWRGWDGGKLP